MADDERVALQDGVLKAAVALGPADSPDALCGGYAAWARGAPAPDHDADFVIREKDVERARTAIAAAGLDVRDPAEDWLLKAYNDGQLIDILFRLNGEQVEDAFFERADVLEVLAVRMPVMSSTDLVSTKLRVLGEHCCDFGRLLPVVRAVREQVDWEAVRRDCADNPYAKAFLYLADELGLLG